jgi:hypothetical protein
MAIPFALSLSKGGSARFAWFDRLTTNGQPPFAQGLTTNGQPPLALSLSKG